VVIHGLGANGKSTLLTVMREIFGTYCVTLPFESLTHDDRRRGGDATPDLVRLPGARLVLASEPEVNARLWESLIKWQTGGEPIMVRPLYQKPFEFLPSHKLVLSFNNKPRVQAQDEGTWRRLVMTPFGETIKEEERVEKLAQQLELQHHNQRASRPCRVRRASRRDRATETFRRPAERHRPGPHRLRRRLQPP
jgi:putative DNA primase/helicase